MNSVVRQLIEQGTDVVMVDTGDSYEGICGYFNGTYISYSKEHPISMNPFKITRLEYEEGFKEKKNFLKSLIILIWKGSSAEMTGVEERVIDLLLEEYYQQYFHPFDKYSPEERKNIRTELMIEAKATGDYQQWREDGRHAGGQCRGRLPCGSGGHHSAGCDAARHGRLAGPAGDPAYRGRAYHHDHG